MKLRNIRSIGRYTHTHSGRQVNIYKGERVGGIGDMFYYLFRQKRRWIMESEMYGSGKVWNKQEASK